MKWWRDSLTASALNNYNEALWNYLITNKNHVYSLGFFSYELQKALSVSTNVLWN